MASNHTDGNMEIPMEVGYICLPISVLIFGSSLIPIKTYDVGDGKLIARHSTNEAINHLFSL